MAACSALADDGVSLRFDRVDIAALVRIVYGELLREPFVIDESLLVAERLTTVDFRGASPDQLRSVLGVVLHGAGYRVRRVDSLNVVEKRVEDTADQEVFSYRPRFRSVVYLQNAVRSFVAKGRFSGVTSVGSGPVAGPQVSGTQPGGAGTGSGLPGSSGSTTQITPGGGIASGSLDVLLFQGPAVEVATVRGLVSALDVAPGEVIIRASVFEVETKKSESSAVELALNVLGGRITGSYGAVGPAALLRVAVGGFSAAMAALSSDSRFKLVSSPSLRATSGESARVSVGSDVPVLGAVTVPAGGGAPIQSVNYQSSGVMLDIHPVVLVDSVLVTLTQQISNFTSTDTGVNGSPTLLKRELASKVAVKSGELVLLGGLEETSATVVGSGLPFLPRWLRSQSSDESRIDLIVMLQVDVL